MLQCNYSFANFQTFVNTGYRNNPCHFSWRVWMLNHLLASLNSELTNLEKTVTRQNRQGISPRYPSFSFWEGQSLAETHQHWFEDAEKTTFDGKEPTSSCLLSQSKTSMRSLIDCNWMELCKQTMWDVTKPEKVQSIQSPSAKRIQQPPLMLVLLLLCSPETKVCSWIFPVHKRVEPSSRLCCVCAAFVKPENFTSYCTVNLPLHLYLSVYNFYSSIFNR